MDPEYLDRVYHKYISNLKQFIPEGFQDIKDVSGVGSNELLADYDCGFGVDKLHYNFFVMESLDKLTLFNKKFTVWIVPEILNSESITYCLIALNKGGDIKPEVAFKAIGRHNRSDVILKFLENSLSEIDENERELSSFYEDDSDF
ncbi:MAG: hypothetical protein RSB82_01015 [Victivallaceae bacterium]